jgi:hypothetical protein
MQCQTLIEMVTVRNSKAGCFHFLAFPIVAGAHGGRGTGFKADPLRRFFDSAMKGGEPFRRPMEDGKMFLECMTTYEDEQELLYRLQDPRQHGVKQLRRALALVTSNGGRGALMQSVLPVLEKLGCDNLNLSMVREPLLNLLDEAFYRNPGLITAFADAVEGVGEGGKPALNDTSAIVWLVLKLVARPEPRVGCFLLPTTLILPSSAPILFRDTTPYTPRV